MKSVIKFVTVANVRAGFMPETNRFLGLIEDSLREKAEGHLRFHGEAITEEAIELYAEVAEFDFSHRIHPDPVIVTIGYNKELELLEKLQVHPSLDKMFLHLGKKLSLQK